MPYTTSTATRLPTLPAAAEMPWHVHRYAVGKISAGRMKVRVLGPADVSTQDSVNKEEAMPTEVEHKVAQRHKEDCYGGAGGPRHAVVDTPCDDEQNGQDEEGDGEPAAPGDAVGENDEAGAAGDRCNGDCQEVLLCLFE